jgi:N-acetylmuramoyl-L-alanine amidase
MATINLIDPTKTELAGNTDYQNLFIYVDMTAERKGYSSYDFDSNSANTSGLKSVNLLGYKRDNKKVFTTDYTLIYNDDNIYEGFGIKSIAIETNASYVPKVVIEFVDIKGMTLFNNVQKSPYSILFDFPPPIFTLKVKGFYGKTLEYKLHMLRHNTKFNADDGNFYITADFVGNTFAPLTDILFQNVLMVPKLYNEDVNIGSRNNVTSLADLVARSKKITNDIVEILTTSDKYKELTKLGESLKIKRDAYDRVVSIDENSAIVAIDKTTLSNDITLNTDKYRLITSSIRLRELVISDNIEYYIVSYRSIKIDEIYSSIFDAFKIKKPNVRLDKTFIEVIFNGVTYQVPVKIKQNITTPIDYVNITNVIKDASKLLNDDEKRYSDQYNTIENDAKTIITNELGFEPTVYEVMKIIANDIDKWINKLIEVYNESVDLVGNSSELRRMYGSDVTKIYPFPDFIESNQKTVPIVGELLTLPEVKFTDEFIDKFINYKKDVALEEQRQTQNVVDDSNSLVWFPINPLDSSSLTDAINPYVGITTIDQLFSVLFSRLYIYYVYTLSINNQTQDRSKYISYFFSNEKNTILNSIKDKTLLNAFKSELEKINSTSNDEFKKSISNYIKFDQINETKNTILTSFKLEDKPELNNSIRFLNINNSPRIDLSDSFWSSFTGENSLINFKYIDSFKVKRLESQNDIGLTLNADNNIMFNDGSPDITNFVAALNSNEEFNLVIKNSINTGLPINSSPLLSSAELIKNTSNINNIIYDYYIKNSTDNFKKLYGLLHIIYVPDLAVIDKIILDKPLHINLPVLTKLYLGALAYAYDTRSSNDIYEVNSSYLSADENILLDQNNKDFIYNLYKNNYRIGKINDSVDTYFKNQRSIIFEKLSIHQSVLDEYKKYFTEFTNNENNINTILNFVNLLLNENGEFNQQYNNIDISNIEFLSEKTTIINSTSISFKEYNFNGSLFGGLQVTKTRLSQIIGGDVFILTYFNTFKNDLITEIPKEVSTLPNEQQQNNNANIQNVRIETYYSFKNFVDRWLVINESNKVTIDDIFKGINYTDSTSDIGLISAFQFIDRASNQEIAKRAIVDISILQEFENDYNVNMLTVISKLLNENGFEFYPLQNFIDFTNRWSTEEVFQPETTDVNKSQSPPRFTCMYVGGTSKYLNSDNNSRTSFKNDGILEIEQAEDFSNSDKAFGFRVRFGDGSQSLFSKIEVSTEEVQPTNESLKSMSLILDNGDKGTIPTAQNLFSTYEQRSYMCKVTMLGDAMIQPTQYFMLENIPMFSGLYLILKVSHSINGEDNTMFTTFEGVRLPKEPRPFITNAFDVYVKSYLDKNLPEVSSRIGDSSAITSDNIEKKDRTIYFIAGHHNEDTGAIAKYDGNNVYERDLTIELRNLLKSEADRNKIKVDIDNDSDTLNQVITNLNSKVQPNDLVLDIHFNSFDKPEGSGIEVFIKDTSNSEIITLAKNIANVVNDTLQIGLRSSNKSNLPTGVKTQEESQYRKLGIFGVNTNVILIEVCFMSNPGEYRTYQSKKKELVQNLIKFLSGISLTENDNSLKTNQTYNILNTLKFNKLNNRSSEFTIPVDKLQTFYEYIKPFDYTKIFEGSKYTATHLQQVYGTNNFSSYQNNIKSQIESTANKYRIDALYLAGILSIESIKFNPLSVSSTGAIGLGQFTFNGAMPEVLGYMNDYRSTSTSVITYNNTFSFTTKTYGQILDILFDNKSINKLIFSSADFRRTLEEEELKEILVKNVFDNPFIII